MAGGRWMGWWGHLGAPKQRGVAIYALSNFEQKAFAGALHQAVFNTFRRVTANAFYIAIPGAIGYSTYTYGKSNHAFRLSKEGHKIYGGEGH
ncbi:ubiquinol--cytochrome-c reductase subunit 8 [Actinomortierella ambigua]|uniref:Cytochrome b-c1 complex subunit 8 n=1 Tax=Actinomortierella ambigua TaxID=1343610 RepID=A0A9P6Q4W8_9FUNG|nr:ubiquinol--cytochrome-c reductase subunit 8 [Actinomortierella ambigua]KAG0260736.1 ubiquinol--cytochrome-c reductase subunit 8 [Actinomortierella ambigua]